MNNSLYFENQEFEREAALHGINMQKAKGLDISKVSAKDAIAQMRAMGINVMEKTEEENSGKE